MARRLPAEVEEDSPRGEFLAAVLTEVGGKEKLAGSGWYLAFAHLFCCFGRGFRLFSFVTSLLFSLLLLLVLVLVLVLLVLLSSSSLLSSLVLPTPLLYESSSSFSVHAHTTQHPSRQSNFFLRSLGRRTYLSIYRRTRTNFPNPIPKNPKSPCPALVDRCLTIRTS